MTEVSTRQFILISLFLFITSTLMTMPPFVYDFAKNDAIMAIIFNFFIEIAILSLICIVIKRNPNTSLFQLLNKKIGKIATYFVYVLLYVFILMKLIYALQEIYSFFNEFLYDDLSPLIFSIPTYFVIGYLAFKGARTIGRVLELIFVVIIIGLVLTSFSNLEYLHFDTMLPYFENGLSPTFLGITKSMFYFGNTIPLLFFVGKVKVNKKFNQKVILSNSILALFIVGFCYVFYDIYGNTTQFILFALSDYSQYDPFLLELQRLNWLSTIVDVTKLFCSTSILLYCLGQAGKDIAHTKSSFYPIIVTLLFVFIRSYILNYDLDTLKNLVAEFASFITIGIIILTALLCVILSIKRRPK